MRCKALLVEFCSARHLQGSCKAVCKAVLVVKSCANISSFFLPISLSSHWLPLAQPLLTARHLQGILHGTCAWQNLEAGSRRSQCKTCPTGWRLSGDFEPHSDALLPITSVCEPGPVMDVKTRKTDPYSNAPLEKHT